MTPKQCECFAREPLECACGVWDDIDIEWWYRDEFNPYHEGESE